MGAVWMNHQDIVELFTLQRARAIARQDVAATNRDPAIIAGSNKRRRAAMSQEEKRAEAAAKRKATVAARKAARQAIVEDARAPELNYALHQQQQE